MPKMSEINVKNSRYFKTKDLEILTGKPWAVAQAIVTVDRAEIGEYAGDAGEPAEPSYLLYFEEYPSKPLGCNWTNRTHLQGIVGDVEWDTENLRGTRLVVFAEQTSLGAGIRIRSSHGAQVPSAGPGATPSDRPPTPVQIEPDHLGEGPPPGDGDEVPF